MCVRVDFRDLLIEVDDGKQDSLTEAQEHDPEQDPRIASCLAADQPEGSPAASRRSPGHRPEGG